jgi:hypothetical protein
MAEPLRSSFPKRLEERIIFQDYFGHNRYFYFPQPIEELRLEADYVRKRQELFFYHDVCCAPYG